MTQDHDLNGVLAQVDRAVMALLESVKPEDLSSHYELALRQNNSRPLAADVFDLFIGRERARFVKAIGIIRGVRASGSVCDLGCFLPYLPLALRKLGYQVTIVDNYSLFGDSLKQAIFRFAKENDIRVVDTDILDSSLTSLVGAHSVVILMAVVEHLHGSPRQLMENVRDILTPDGILLFEVPNIADLGSRLQFLLGRSPLPDYAQYLFSDYPFRGHSREMTMAEVLYLLRQTGFHVARTWCYDYWIPDKSRVLGRTFELAKRLLPIHNRGQSIMALAQPRVRDR